jgi:uncharacterized glyoxalase superfamily protein PhnB
VLAWEVAGFAGRDSFVAAGKWTFPTANGGAADTPSQPRAGFHSVTPRIVTTDLDAQVRFLREGLEAQGDVVPGRPAELRIGDALVMVSAADQRAPFPAFLYVYVDDADRAFERAVAAGATVVEPPGDTPYGDRRAMVRDPFGNEYQLAHVLG